MAMVMIRCPAFEVQAFAGIDKLRVALDFWYWCPKTRDSSFFISVLEFSGCALSTTWGIS